MTAPGWPTEQLAPLEQLPPLDTETVELAEDEVHIWYCFYDRARDDHLIQAYTAMLTPDERERHGRFFFEKDRHEYLVTRALVRTVLSRYAQVAPGDWRFVRNEHGKPFVSAPPGVLWPSFNLSNTRGLVACAVGRCDDVLGVDVEDTERKGETMAVADSYFSVFEVRALRSLPAFRQRERFFSYWTLKEAYIKARGMGLAIPLDQFSFHLDEGARVRVSFDPRLKDDPEAWAFALFRASPRHFLAFARRGRAGAPPKLRAAHVVPLERSYREVDAAP